MAARRSSVASLLLWMAALAQGRESTAASPQSLEVSLSTTSLGMAHLLGHGIDLTCSLNSSDAQPYNTLQWLDGEIPIESSASREIIRCGNSITLRFHNFSTLDFGMYTCRCVNEDYEMEQFCSQPSSIIHLPEELPNITEVEIPSTLVLNCDNNGSTWTKINSTAVEVWKDRMNVSVTSPQDQGKFVCHDGSTVHQIVYVYIKGYQPIRIFYPHPNQAASVFNKNKRNIEMCSAHIPSATSSIRLYVIRNTGMELLYPTYIPVPAAVYRSDKYGYVTVTAREFNINQVKLTGSVRSVFEVETIYSAFREQLQNQSYMCTFSSKWETISVTFNLTLLQSASVTTESPQITSTVLPNMCTGILPPISSTSVSPSATPGVSSLQLGTTMVPPMSPSPSPTNVITPQASNQGSAMIAGITVSVIIATVAVLMSVTVIVLWRRHSRNNRRGKITHKDKSSIRRLLIPRSKESLRASSMHNNLMTRPSLVLSQQKDSLHSLAPVSLMYDGVPISRQLAKCFCELEKSQWLFPYKDLKFEGELGSGAFGVVRKAQALSMQSGNPSTTVAVKTLKDITSDEDEKDIISELKVLQHVGVHPNVVSLLGAAIHEGKLHIIVEFCCHGNLLHYLRLKRKDPQNPLCTRQLVKMAGQIARGMEHLSSKNCIHRDLAARNVLIGEGFVLKVADFGLARKMYHTIYKPSGGKIPIKWMAPETIIDQEYTSQSDVWSFGILLWEIMTLGRSPYPGKSAGSVLKDVKTGYRMPKPVDCPQSMYDVMSKCWHLHPSARPTFSHLGSIFEAMLKQEMPNHYYNILDETIVDDISDSTSHDSPSEACCQCSYSKNDNTTSTSSYSTCTSVFCSHCRLNNPDYINKVVENGKLQKNATRVSVDSCDSGVHESVSDRPSTSVSELTPTNSSAVDTKEDTEHQPGAYSNIITSNTEEQGYLPCKPSQSRSCLPTIRAAESVQSLCSNCRAECGQQEVDTESLKMKTGSVLSLCSTCKVQLGCESIVQTAAESITIDMDKVTHWNSHTDNTNWSNDTRCTDVPNPSYYNTLGALLFGNKDPLAAQKSNDSGIVSVCSETWEGYVWNKSQPDQTLKVLPDCTKLATTNECSDQSPHSVDTTMITAETDSLNAEITRNRLSAHPRYRSLFDQLGIQESDV